jgi:hypothetical protein
VRERGKYGDIVNRENGTARKKGNARESVSVCVYVNVVYVSESAGALAQDMIRLSTHHRPPIMNLDHRYFLK